MAKCITSIRLFLLNILGFTVGCILNFNTHLEILKVSYRHQTGFSKPSFFQDSSSSLEIIRPHFTTRLLYSNDSRVLGIHSFSLPNRKPYTCALTCGWVSEIDAPWRGWGADRLAHTALSFQQQTPKWGHLHQPIKTLDSWRANALLNEDAVLFQLVLSCTQNHGTLTLDQVSVPC